MLLIMVGNVVSIFTQVYITKVTPIQFLCSFAAYNAIYISFLSLSPCQHFHGCFICYCHRLLCTVGFLLSFFLIKIQQSFPLQSRVKSMMNILPFRFSWWSLTIQNVGIHYAGVHKIPEMHFHALTDKSSTLYFMQLIMTIYTIHMSLVQLNV